VSPARAMLLAAGAALAAAGCNGQPRSQDPGDPNAVVWDIEHRSHGEAAWPVTLIEAGRQIYGPGAEIKVTVHIVAPPGMAKLDAYLPIRGRFHVREEGALVEARPLESAADRVWVDLPPDERDERERVFSVVINRVFPMRAGGWYLVWWDGEAVNAKVQSDRIGVRILAAPAGR